MKGGTAASKTKGLIMAVKAYLQVIMKVNPENRDAAAKVYFDYRQPFLDTIPGALTKELLVRDEDVQVIHGFDSMEHAKAYLDSDLFTQKVAPGLKPTWAADPDIRFYTVA
jgi:heme-degrading monooxygenase HmoA